MSAESLALLSAFFLAISGIAARFGLLRQPSPFTAFITFSSGAAAAWVVILVFQLPLPGQAAAMLFALRGVLDPGIAALLIFAAFRKIGLSITIPIIAAAPLVSTTLSVLFLGESLALVTVLGTVLVIGGVAMLSLKRDGKRAGFRHLSLAIVGAALIGVSIVLAKLGLNISPSPVPGLAVSFTSGALLHVVVIGSLGKWREISFGFGKSGFFVLSGLLAAIGFGFNYAAFAVGFVSVVAPIVAVQPLFTLLLSRILLRKVELINKYTVAGTFLIVACAALLTAF